MNFEGLIEINKAIVHIINPKENYCKLSGYELEKNKRLENLITKYINTSIKYDTRRFAKFNQGENIVRKASINMLNDDNVFIEESQKISKELFRSMQRTNASPANFLIVKYTHDNKKAIALLKLDFNNNFYTRDVEENGKTKIEVKIEDAGFNDKQKIQKCAFIYEDITLDSQANIVILDKQSKDEVSNYFGNIFLNSSLLNDNRVNTNNMIDEINKFINEKYINEPKTQLAKTYELTTYFKQSLDFEIDDMLNKVFDEDQTRNEFKEKIGSKTIDYSFKIDDKKVEQKFKCRHISTNNGIMIKANASLFNSESIDISEKNEDGFVDIIIKKVKIAENK